MAVGKVGLTHEYRIERLLAADPRLSRFGFAKSMFEALASEQGDKEVSKSDVIRVLRDSFPTLPRPDAWRIECHPEQGGQISVTCVEVINTSDIKDGKMNQYVDLWWALDCESSWLTLEVYSHHGALLGTYREDDFASLWHGRLTNKVCAW